MRKRLTKQQEELYQRIDEILYYQWDPIGVSDEPEARDEYASYVPVIFSMVIHGKSPEEISKKLSQLEEDIMGTSSKSEGNCLSYACQMIKYRELVLR